MDVSVSNPDGAFDLAAEIATPAYKSHARVNTLNQVLPCCLPEDVTRARLAVTTSRDEPPRVFPGRRVDNLASLYGPAVPTHVDENNGAVSERHRVYC